MDPTPAQLTEGYIEFFEPDVFVEASLGLAEEAGVSGRKLDEVYSRVAGLDGYRTGAELPFGLDSAASYRAIWDRDFKFQSEHRPQAAIFSAGGDDAWIEMAFGGFPSAGPLAALSDAYRRMFRPAELAPNADSWREVTEEKFIPPLSFNDNELTAHFGRRDNRLTVFVADPGSPLDLLDCWNLRQVCRDVLVVNLNWLSAAPEAIRSIAGEAIASQDRSLPVIEIQFGRSVFRAQDREGPEKAHAMLVAAGFDFPFLHGLYPGLWFGGQARALGRQASLLPRRAVSSAKSVTSEIEISEDLTCWPPLLTPDESDDFGQTRAARWVNVLSFAAAFGEAEKLALIVPSSFDASKPRRFGYAGQPRLASREGLVLPMIFKQHQASIHLLTGPEALIAWLGDVGVRAKRSAAGRTADQVLERLGGLHRTRILGNAETLKFLNDAAMKVRKSCSWSKWRDHFAKRAGEAAGMGPFAPRLEDVVGSGVVRLGLELQCPRCSEANWYAATELKRELVCEGCLGKFPFPESSLDLEHSPWHYRVIGPFSKTKFADGAYAVVLAMSVFARLEMAPELAYAAGLDMEVPGADGRVRDAECDFALWWRPRPIMPGLAPDPALIFGEAKSFGRDAFAGRDVVRLWRLWRRFPDAFFVFATLRDALDDREKRRVSRFARAASAGGAVRKIAPIIILTSTELFSPLSLHAAWLECDGIRKQLAAQPSFDPSDPRGLARVTQQAYL